MLQSARKSSALAALLAGLGLSAALGCNAVLGLDETQLGSFDAGGGDVALQPDAADATRLGDASDAADARDAGEAGDATLTDSTLADTVLADSTPADTAVADTGSPPDADAGADSSLDVNLPDAGCLSLDGGPYN